MICLADLRYIDGCAPAWASTLRCKITFSVQTPDTGFHRLEVGGEVCGHRAEQASRAVESKER